MPALVLGDRSAPFLEKLSSRLKEETRKVAEELDNRSYDFYTPWMSMRPLLNKPIKEKLLHTQRLEPGDLVTDPGYLAAVQRFLDTQGMPIMVGMPVAPEDWPVMADIKATRPDAIAAFQEGRALLRTSKFLNRLYPSLVDCVIPQRRVRPSGFDSAFARGAVFRTFPEGRTGLLAGFQLAHAMGHQAAILLQSADPLIDPIDRNKVIFYEVRQDQRTADHAMVSAVALSYMCVLARAIYGDVPTPAIMEAHVQGFGPSPFVALKRAVRSIRNGATTTAAGRQVLEEMDELVLELEPLPD